MDVSKIQSEGDLFKLAQSFYILKRLKSTKTQHAKKTLPFEEIDFTLYDAKCNMLGFKTTRHRLCGWAYALLWHHALSPEIDSEMKVQVRLLDSKGKDVTSVDPGLYKLQIHVNKGEVTLVSIHLYFTCASIHVQGKAYRTWGNETFQKVKDTVDKIAPKIKKAREESSNEAEELEKSGEMAHEVTVVHKEMPDDNAESGVNLQQMELEEDISLSESSKLSEAGALPSPKATSTPTPKSTPDKDPVKSSTSKQSSPKDKFLSQANDLRRKSNDVITQLDGSVADLIQRVNVLENTNSNKLSDIQTMLQQVISKQDQMSTRLDNISQDNAKSNENAVKRIQKLQSDHTKTSQSVNTIMQNVLAVTQDMNSVKTDIKKLQSDHTKTSQSVNTTMQNVLTVTQDMNSVKTDIAVLKVTPAQPADPAPPKPPLPPPPNTQATAPADAKKPIEKNANDGDTEDSGFTTVTNGATNRKPDREPPVIDPATDTLVMSDSMLSMMTDTMLKPHKAQIVAYGGLDTEELTNILEKIKRCETVENAILHVGYKDSKNGPIPDITEQSISKLIKAASQSFPKANIYVTSVLPARNNKNRVNVDSYNLTIESACEKNSALYVDLTACAVGQNGKINNNLFRDVVHPNGNGTKNIAAKLVNVLPVRQNESDDDDYETINDNERDSTAKDETPAAATGDGTPTIKSTPVFEEKGNKFQAHYAVVRSREEQRKALAAINAKASDATTNTVAYTFQAPGKRYPSQETIDDGEFKAGKVMMDAIEDYKGSDCLVVVSRWYAADMGPRRFQIYYNLTAAALGHNPLQNRPYPNRYPQIPSYSSPPRNQSSPSYWNQSDSNIPQLMQMGYPPYMPSQPPPSWYGKPLMSGSFPNSYGTGPWTHPMGNPRQYGGQRYTYYNGKRIMVQV